MPKSTYHHGNLRQALLQAAAEAITENGIATLSMRDLAKRVDVSHAAPTHHFGDKAGLLTALAIEGFDQLAKALATSRLASGSFIELGVTYVRFAVTRRAQFEVMFRTDLYHARDPEVMAARRRAADALYDAVSGLPDGALAPTRHEATRPLPVHPTLRPGADPAFIGPIDEPADAPATVGEGGLFPPARPAREGAAASAAPHVRAAGLAAWSMAHGFATLWLSGAFPDRDQDPMETARIIFTQLSRPGT